MTSDLDEHGQPPPSVNLHLRSRRLVDQFIGMAQGFTVDGKLTHEECSSLISWLEKNLPNCAVWPLNIVYDRIASMLSDNVIDDDERAELYDLLKNVSGSSDIVAEIAAYTTTLPLDTPQPAITFKAASFCITGRFLELTRKQAVRLINERGGFWDNDLRKHTEVLVIGTIGSRDWLHASFGTKILKAKEWRDSGHDIAIISEAHFISQARANETEAFKP